MKIIKPVRAVRGRVKLPGDKSISHRAALLAGAAQGETRIENFATSADCHSTLACLRSLGVEIETYGTSARVVNRNMVNRKAGTHKQASCFVEPLEMLDCGNSGSTMRMLAGFLAWQNFTTTLAGDRSLNHRPMTRVIKPLELMGARITSNEGRAPLVIEGRAPLEAVRYELPVASAQVKSCVLFAGLGAHGRTTVIERTRTRDHSERMLSWFAADVAVNDTEDGREISISGDGQLVARDCTIPGDVSSSAFLVAAALLLPASGIEIRDVCLNPTRTQFLETLKAFNANLETYVTHEACGEPVGIIRARSSDSLGAKQNVISGGAIPNLIDELPMLAVLGTQTETGLVVRDAGELRVKETDRIRAVVENLRRMGARVEEHADGFAVEGRTRLKGARLDSFDDHRIAMAFSVAALIAEGDTAIDGAECAGVSFPNFYELLAELIEDQ